MATLTDTIPQIDSASSMPLQADSRRSTPLDEALLRRLYAYMLKCRMVEERIRLLYRQGRFAGNYFAAVGQEATEVGATLDLLPEDTIAPSHRNFVAHIMKGTPLRSMFAHIYGRATSPDQGRSAPAHCGYAPLNIITPASTIAAQSEYRHWGGTRLQAAKKSLISWSRFQVRGQPVLVCGTKP